MPQTQTRQSYFYLADVTTRWSDNDIYGHVNNVQYYSYFDSVANKYLIERAGLDIYSAEIVGFVVASQCEYFSPIAYPDQVQVGFRVNRLGDKSVEYGMAIFKADAEQACAAGTFTHVFVNRSTGKSAAIPDSIRQALELAIN